MGTNSPSTSTHRGKQLTWKQIVLEALSEQIGEKVGLDRLYALVRAHPAAVKRSGNHNREAKIRQQLQVLAREGVVEHPAKGVWRLPAKP